MGAMIDIDGAYPLKSGLEINLSHCKDGNFSGIFWEFFKILITKLCSFAAIWA